MHVLMHNLDILTQSYDQVWPQRFPVIMAVGEKDILNVDNTMTEQTSRKSSRWKLCSDELP